MTFLIIPPRPPQQKRQPKTVPYNLFQRHQLDHHLLSALCVCLSLLDLPRSIRKKDSEKSLKLILHFT